MCFQECIFTVFFKMLTHSFLNYDSISQNSTQNVLVMYLTLVEGGNGDVTLVLTDELGSRETIETNLLRV